MNRVYNKFRGIASRLPKLPPATDFWTPYSHLLATLDGEKLKKNLVIISTCTSELLKIDGGQDVRLTFEPLVRFLKFTKAKLIIISPGVPHRPITIVVAR